MGKLSDKFNNLKLVTTISNIWKIEELRTRILITIGLVAVYLFGTQIVLPGVDRANLGKLHEQTSEGLMALGGSLKTGMKVALQSVIGGTLSELGGGNFANGAITAAFSFLFNHLKHFKNSFLNIKSGQ